MKILRTLISSVEKDAPVRDVIISTHSTLVSSQRCGISSTLLSTKPHGEEVIRDAGFLHLKTAKELANYALSDNTLEASIGLAAINSIIETNPDMLIPLDASLLATRLSIEKNVTVIGHFPFIPKVKEAASHCWVLELNPIAGEHSTENAKDIISHSDLIAISASTLINHTLEDLLEFCRKDATVMLIGPSTPLSPLLFEFNIDVLSGIVVEDETKVIKAISQGAIFRQMQGVKRMVMIKPKFKPLLEGVLS
jgi:uncharacterized protein (DUF4213/DUF364 family)